jgi:acetyl-CoA C-acetyltransferase
VVDARTPVIIGGGQWSNRVDQGEPPVEPVDLVTEALTRAADDSGTPQTRALLGAADAIWIVEMLSWRYPDPGALVAERIGAKPRDTARSPIGGNEPQSLVNQACRAVARGDADVVLIGGAEAWRSRGNPGGKELGWTSDERPEARRTGDEAPLSHPAETALQIYMPTQVYPLFEQAFRHRQGRSVEEHLGVVAELWARFSEIGAANPHAWTREPLTAEQIRTPGDGNRWIGWPYTKVMNSNLAVEQGAGVIVASAEKARTLKVPRDRWVFPLASTEAHDHYAVSNRIDLASSPAIRLAGRKLRDLAGVHPVEADHVDLYSCFPSAVEVAATELGLPLDGSIDLTVTGGLSFAGGPWNNYVSHSLATMVGHLREDPGSIGLVTANGGYLTKHGLGLYSTEPPADGFKWASVQDDVDALPRREVLEPSGAPGAAAPALPAELESWTVLHDRDNRPEKAIATVLLDDGRRAWGVSTEGPVLAELISGAEQIGRKVEVAGGELRL